MQIKPSTLLGTVIIRPAQRDYTVEHVFAARRAALLAALASMMDEQHASTGAPVRQRPSLHREPGLGLILFARADQRRDVVDDDQLGIADHGINLLLPLFGSEV